MPLPWIILGLLLVSLELIAPGAFLLWLGLAAVLTGVVDWLFGLSWQAAMLAFATLSVGAVLIGRALTRQRPDEDDRRPLLNRRAQALVGRVFVFDSPISGGTGRLRLDDSSWRILGPDVPAGAAVKVVRVDGATLIVGPAAELGITTRVDRKTGRILGNLGSNVTVSRELPRSGLLLGNLPVSPEREGARSSRL